MQTRRDFIKSAAALGALAAWPHAMPDAIRRALAIEPAGGSTFLDAEHVVILMQENRSFDHAFGTLRGVRGFNDPRAITSPDGNPVWAQADEAGRRYVPFRLDIKNTKITWMGSLPHSWTDQTDARNGGRHDRWLTAKKSGHAEYASLPLTMGHYSREDIPFYYALADAFTICDQHFCSSLTGTTPNRLHFWTGTIRAESSVDSLAHVRNEDTDHKSDLRWTTFPERLETHGVSWKFYQNELSTPSGLDGEEDAWLSNFTDNPIEWFAQYNGRFAASHRAWLPKEIERLRKELATARREAPGDKAAEAKIEKLTRALAEREGEAAHFTEENFQKLSPTEKSLHARALCTNAGDPAYRELDEIEYMDGDTRRRVQVPKGDVLHQFRKDVENGELPTVSWLVAPERFSDHPGSAWYGAWYIAETLDILTRNPEVWKKTIFILTYDENDGYFDHVPPFTPPHPTQADAGKASAGVDTTLEHVELEHDLKRKPAKDARGGPIGLGYRVPMIIASPWTRGGCVCSQVFDHTSVLQFLETFLTQKTGKKIEESNISAWRRTVCGDLTAAFGAADLKAGSLPFESRDAFIEQIHQAQFKGLPTGRPLTDSELEAARHGSGDSTPWPSQEPGVRRAAPLPYELEVNGRLSDDRARFVLSFEAKKDRFGERSAGAPFIVYAINGDDVKVRNYAVKAGDRLEDTWRVDDFHSGRGQLRVYGPNGFFREFVIGAQDPPLAVAVRAREGNASGDVEIRAALSSGDTVAVEITDNAYQSDRRRRALKAGEESVFVVETSRSFGWYDFSVMIEGRPDFKQRFAGKVENGRWTFSDPAMGRVSV